MHRRDVLRIAAGGTGATLAGCLGSGESGPTPQQPEDCPTSEDLGVEWPDELTGDTVESFVRDYEDVYYREVVVAFEKETGLEEYVLGVSVASEPTESGAGYEVEVRGGGGVYTPTLWLTATVADPPEDVEPHSTDTLDTGLASLLRDAADDPDEEVTQDVMQQSNVAQYVETINGLADGEPLAGKHDAATLYFDVEGTTVELSVEASSFHGDYGWQVWYYVDENVVRRTTEEDADPAEGELLECRVD